MGPRYSINTLMIHLRTNTFFSLPTSVPVSHTLQRLSLRLSQYSCIYPWERWRAGGRSALLSLWRAAAPPPGRHSTAAGTLRSRSDPPPRGPPLKGNINVTTDESSNTSCKRTPLHLKLVPRAEHAFTTLTLKTQMKN